MIETRTFGKFIFLLLLLPAGCAENKYLLTTDRLCTQTASKQTVMAFAEKTLSEMQFAVEKCDIEAGVIRTFPLPGAQSFEFWRADSVGPFNQTEADIHSIRRTVEINIIEQNGEFCINCVATTERLSIDGDEQAAASQSTMRRSGRKLRDNHRNIRWIDLGRDSQIETEIIKRIQKKLAS